MGPKSKDRLLEHGVSSPGPPGPTSHTKARGQHGWLGLGSLEKTSPVHTTMLVEAPINTILLPQPLPAILGCEAPGSTCKSMCSGTFPHLLGGQLPGTSRAHFTSSSGADLHP